MKKRVWLIALFSIFIVFLGACSDKKTSGTKEKASDKKTMETVETRTITDDTGRKVEIPTNPKRVVTDWYLGQLLALGVVPVGAPVHNLDYAEFLKDYYTEGDIDDIGDVAQSMEKVLDLNPDVIITWSEDYAEKYEKIAPTIVLSETDHDSISEEITAIGKYLGKEKEAEAFNKDFEKRITAAREKILNHIKPDAIFTIYALSAKDVHLVSNNSVNGGRALYTVLGMKAPEKVQKLMDSGKFDYGSYPISWETLQEFEGDYTFYLKSDTNADDQTLWKNLETVKNGRAIELPMSYYFASDALSVLNQAEDLADKIAEVADKK